MLYSPNLYVKVSVINRMIKCKHSLVQNILKCKDD